MNVIKRLFCKHDYEFVRNIYGDEINHVGGARSWWRCKKCGMMALGEHLHPELERRMRKLGIEVDDV